MLRYVKLRALRGCEMAVRILAKVWEGYPGDSSVELLALLALADWSDDEGRSFPSNAAIGRKCRISERQAQRLIRRLIATDLVSITDNANGGKPGTTRRFKINLEKLTGVENDRGVNSVTGVKNDVDGCHLRRGTGGENVTQYVIDTSLTVNTVSRRKKSGITLKQFLEACKESGEQTIPETDPVFKYAQKIGLPEEFVFLGWQAFKEKQGADKLQKDWRKTFRSYVRNPDWLGVWKLNQEGEFYLTGAGKQIEREFAGASA